MEINYLFHLWRVCFLFWGVNFVVSFPICFILWIKYKSKLYLHLNQLIGFSFWAIFLSWMSFINARLLLDYWWMIFVCLGLVSIFMVFFVIKKGVANIQFIKKYLTESILSCLVYVFVLFVFVVPQGVFPPFVPGYKVSEDAIGILYVAKALASGGDNGSMYRALFDIGYPYAFPIVLIFISNLIGYSFYFSAQILNILLLSLSFFPIFHLLKLFLRKGNSLLLGFSTLLGMVTYLSVQFTNQSFYSQTFLVPFMYSTLLMTIIILNTKTKWVDLVLFMVFFCMSIFAYSFTILLWLLPLGLILISKCILKKEKIINKIYYLLLSGIFSLVLIIPHSLRAINFFKRYFLLKRHMDGTGGFWGAKGNSIGYASILNAFSSWLGTDFRLYKDIFVNNSILFTTFFFILVIVSLIIHRSRFKKNTSVVVVIFLSFLLPIIFSRYVLKSTYYYNKTLYYASFVYVSLMSVIILMNFFYKKFSLLISATAIVMCVFLNYTYRSLHYYGKPPLHQYLSLEKMTEDLKTMSFKEKIIAVDSDDWLKYFLFDYGSCVVYAKTYSCGMEHVEEVDGGFYKLNSGNYYLLNSVTKNKVKNIKDGTLVYESAEYVLYHF